MKKILIYCKTFSTAQNLINHIVGKISTLQIVGLSSTIEDALETINKCKPQFIISTDSNIIKKVDAAFPQLHPKIILITKNLIRTQSIIENQTLLLGEQYNYEQMITKISNFIGYEERMSDQIQAQKLLTNLGFKLKLKGSAYLIEAIVFTKYYRTQNYSLEDLNKIIYPHVAKVFSTDVNNVKWAVDRAVKYTYESRTKENYTYYTKYFSTKYPEKVTSKTIINTLARLLK